MSANIVLQPIIGPDGEATAYELLYEDQGISLYNQQDTHAANIIEDFLMQLDSSKLLDDKKAFVTFTPTLLEKDIPSLFHPDALVIQIEDNILVHPVAHKLVYEYQRQGYQIAMKGFEFSGRYFGALDVIDIIKINMSRPNPSLSSIIDISNKFEKVIIGSDIDTKNIYDTARAFGLRYLQGTVVAENMYTPAAQMEHLQSNFFQLIVAITDPEPDMDEIAAIIERDVTLTFSLLKLVNSAYFALRNPARGVKQALVVLGVEQLRQWIYLLSFKSNDGKIPTELIKTSFLRGEFSQSLAGYISRLPISANEAYLLGMFSTLDLLMGVPMEEVLEPLPVSDEIKNALLTQEGRCGDLYNLVLKYDTANFKGAAPYADRLKVDFSLVGDVYLQSAEYVNTTWTALMRPYATDVLKK